MGVLEAKGNLLPLRQDIPLSEPEIAEVVQGVRAYDELLAQLADVPTPAGCTPPELAAVAQIAAAPNAAK